MNAQFHSSMMDIKYASHGKNMCIKYGRSRMNDAHIMSMADLGRQHYFRERRRILYDIRVGRRSSDFRSQRMNSFVLISIIIT